MFDAVSASTVSAPACAPAPVGPSSSDAVPRVVIASQPDSGRRSYRSLRAHGEFSRVYKTGKRRRCGGLTTIVAPGPVGQPTVGFVVGKRVGSAVIRNRAKRRMREAAARCVLKSDTVYVLIADRRVLTADFDRLISWIERCTSDLSTAEET